MKENRPPAENPTTALYDLAQEMADNYYKVRYVKAYAYAFLGIILFILVVLFVAFLSDGNLALGIISLALFISGLMLLRVILFMREFLGHFDKNFRAIRLVYEADPLPPVPDGKSPAGRLRTYLSEHDPESSREVERDATSCLGYVYGGSKWDVAVHRPKKFLGKPPYMALATLGKGDPNLKDFIELEKKLEKAITGGGWPPNRAIIAYRAPKEYDGVSEDLYSYLTEKEHFVLQKGKKVRLRIQLFVETGGKYEIIPVLP